MVKAPPPTVSSLKLDFLSSQASALARPSTAPSQSWLAAHEASDQPLPGRAVGDAIIFVGIAIQQHSRRVYHPQANRHVADQISDVYAREAERRVAAAQAEVDALAVGKGLDLVDDDTIEILPPTWPVQRQVSDDPLEAERYADTVARLVQLNQERRRLREQVETLRQLKETVDPLSKQVQENLVTRNGPVESELEKMRLLLARVAGRVSELPDVRPTGPTREEEEEEEEGGVDVGDLAQTGGGKRVTGGGKRVVTLDEFFSEGGMMM
ncbi:hypothetical protein L249_0559 [Ophiocordyceps polyrhachis-furcata BCC 54312]|uniref:Kinetochore protein fta4 n=1 Tax=Ophiocordyceps polyrhachis-furcata BCC 54312 TaxID=1330021 RepID=A0A367LCD8_9HYPO|nr:hypothetical protein L249_0559 [Ophiocordyceps polyrhachis-furcata BCC 54312]